MSTGPTPQELGASMEALGTFYANKGKVDYAVPLYLQALSVLLPPSTPEKARTTQPTTADRCHAGILMNNLSQLFVSSSPNPENISQARAWAAKGLDVVETATRKAGIDQPSTLSSAKEGSNAQAVEKEERQTQNTCASAQATLLHNLGVLSEMSDDACTARTFFQRAYKHADAFGLRDARAESAQALARLERMSPSGKRATSKKA